MTDTPRHCNDKPVQRFAFRYSDLLSDTAICFLFISAPLHRFILFLHHCTDLINFCTTAPNGPVTAMTSPNGPVTAMTSPNCSHLRNASPICSHLRNASPICSHLRKMSPNCSHLRKMSPNCCFTVFEALMLH